VGIIHYSAIPILETAQEELRPVTPVQHVRQRNGYVTIRRNDLAHIAKNRPRIAEVLQDVRENDQSKGAVQFRRYSGFQIVYANALAKFGRFRLFSGTDGNTGNLPPASGEGASVVTGATAAVENT
jgi:hypothetical protein